MRHPTATNDVRSNVAPIAKQPSTSLAALAVTVAAILASGTLSFACFELQVKAVAGSTVFITLLQYVSVIVANFSWKVVKAPRIPAMDVLFVAVATFAANQLANAAINSGLPIPVYLVLKNLNLPISSLLAMVLLKQRFPLLQLACIATITGGVIAAVMLFTASPESPESPSPDAMSGSASSMWLLVGGALAVVASLVCVAVTGIRQQVLFQRHGADCSTELLFWTHLLGLVGFVPLLNTDMVRIGTTIATGSITLVGVPVPIAAISLGNLLCGVAIKRGVCSLMSSSGSVTTTLVITLYRLMSMLVSTLLISGNASPPPVAWAAVATVFASSAVYAMSKKTAAPAASGGVRIIAGGKRQGQ